MRASVRVSYLLPQGTAEQLIHKESMFFQPEDRVKVVGRGFAKGTPSAIGSVGVVDRIDTEGRGFWVALSESRLELFPASALIRY